MTSSNIILLALFQKLKEKLILLSDQLCAYVTW